MATPLEELPPVAPAVEAPVAPTEVPTTPVLGTLNPSAVYSATNIQGIDIPSTKKVMDMKLSKLESKLAKANSIAELNQIGIMNQPKAMGVLTGEASYRDKLDTARINAFNSLYNARIADENRKETEKQNFMATYGADPNQRPKGMSKKEFASALQSGKFSQFLTTDFKTKQAELAKALAPEKQSSTQKIGAIIQSSQNELNASKGTDGFANPELYMKKRGEYAAESGDVTGFDSQFSSQLSPAEQARLGISTLTSAQQQKMVEAEAAKGKQADALEQKIALIESIDAGGRGVGSGWTGKIERNFFDPFGAKAENVNAIKSLVGREVLDNLLALKAQGGTLGAVSEKELDILQSSATVIAAAEVRDDSGNVTGYNISEKEMKNQLDAMKKSAQIIIDDIRRKTGGVTASDPLGIGI